MLTYYLLHYLQDGTLAKLFQCKFIRENRIRISFYVISFFSKRYGKRNNLSSFIVLLFLGKEIQPAYTVYSRQSCVLLFLLELSPS